jgi:hypothetical protein
LPFASGVSTAGATNSQLHTDSVGTAHANDAVTVLKPGTIEAKRFVKSFNLSGGALTLTPFRGVTPKLTSAEETAVWATDGVYGVIQGVGFADVTVKRSMTKKLAGPPVGRFENTPSFVELTKSDEIRSCTFEPAGEGTTVIPVSQGWYAVIFPVSSNKSDVVFSAASNVCQRLTPNTVSAAYETVSIVWHLATHATTGTVIVAIVPKCGHIIMSGGGGNEFTRQFEYEVDADVLDRSVGTTCSPATDVDEGQNYASPSTTHGFIGPVLSVGPHAGDVMTRNGPRAQPLVWSRNGLTDVTPFQQGHANYRQHENPRHGDEGAAITRQQLVLNWTHHWIRRVDRQEARKGAVRLKVGFQTNVAKSLYLNSGFLQTSVDRLLIRNSTCARE